MGAIMEHGTDIPEKHSSPSGDIEHWDVENNAFWESQGKRIAYRNLMISVPALLCAFAVWGMWGIITVQMHNLGFPFTQAELFTLTAIAGDRKSTRLNSSHSQQSRMPSSA